MYYFVSKTFKANNFTGKANLKMYTEIHIFTDSVDMIQIVCSTLISNHPNIISAEMATLVTSEDCVFWASNSRRWRSSQNSPFQPRIWEIRWLRNQLPDRANAQILNFLNLI